MKYALILLLLIPVLSVTAQDGKKEKIDALRVGFITKELNLTTEEAQKFWPVFNQYQDELEKLRKQRRSELMDAKENFDSMSDADISKVIDNEMAFQQQELDLRKRYVTAFKQVLPVKKVARLLKAEQQFKLKLLQEYRERQGGGPDGHDGPPGPGRKSPRD